MRPPRPHPTVGTASADAGGVDGERRAVDAAQVRLLDHPHLRLAADDDRDHADQRDEVRDRQREPDDRHRDRGVDRVADDPEWAGGHQRGAFGRVDRGAPGCAHPLTGHVDLAAILAGALANLIDRAADGVVTDYLHTGWIPTFNLADTLITLGAALLVLATLRNPNQSNERNTNDRETVD